MHQVTDGDAFVTSDVGQHQMWAAQFYGFDKPRRWINSGGLGTMGFGLPAAMGVQLAFPDEKVACVTGEASFVMCVKNYRRVCSTDYLLKLLISIIDIWGWLGNGKSSFMTKYSHSYMDALPDFVKLAESFGHGDMK